MGKETKICKHCKSEIAEGAKVCPFCQKKQGMGLILKIVIGIFVLGIIGAALGGGKDKDKDKGSQTSTTVAENKEETTAKETETEVTYAAYSVSEMMSDLESNAMSASDKYKNQHIEITGRLGVIDSSGKYIALYPEDDDFAITGVTCYIKNDSQKEAVKSMNKDDVITLRGMCKEVGEVLGYSLDIESVN